MKPMLMRSPLTGTVYIVTRYRKLALEGRFEAQIKYEVTTEELAAIGFMPIEQPA